jgi:hypothetical protein
VPEPWKILKKMESTGLCEVSLHSLQYQVKKRDFGTAQIHFKLDITRIYAVILVIVDSASKHEIQKHS